MLIVLSNNIIRLVRIDVLDKCFSHDTVEEIIGSLVRFVVITLHFYEPQRHI